MAYERLLLEGSIRALRGQKGSVTYQGYIGVLGFRPEMGLDVGSKVMHGEGCKGSETQSSPFS